MQVRWRSRRRILRRMMLRRADTPERYLETLRNDRSEAQALSEDILINVTEFSRDHAAFDALKTIVFPRITQQSKGERHAIRIWVPGCRHELAESRRSLRSAIEDQQAAHEELRCAVEEIQCSNEELRAREKSSKQRGQSCSPRTKG